MRPRGVVNGRVFVLPPGLKQGCLFVYISGKFLMSSDWVCEHNVKMRRRGVRQ